MIAEPMERLTASARACGADRAAVIPGSEVVTDPVFREMCAANACGVYGRCWTCPPDVGEIGELIASLAAYDSVLVYQTVSPLEDSFDFEGMTEARHRHYGVSRALDDALRADAPARLLHLGAGGCGVCEVCAKRTNEPCRYPDRALASLEAYGVNVSALAKAAGMRYINGQNTVTYFGAVFFTA